MEGWAKGFGLVLGVIVGAAGELSGADVEVDFNQSLGSVQRLNGVINSIRLTQFADERARLEYAALDVPYVRNHDTGLTNPGYAVLDVSRIFPLAYVDENDPKNYDFAASDDYLALTREFCCEIEFKFGESIEHSRRRFRVNPPADLGKYARICRNIVRHYNDGWANGFRWNIRRWSVWEEPDNPKLFNGDYQREFFPLYAAIVNEIKALDSSYEVGGVATRGREMFRAAQFVGYCRAHSLPLDFCSITDYRREPETILALGRELRTILDTNGYTRTTIDLSEWHYEPMKWSPLTGEDRANVLREVSGVNGGAFTLLLYALGQDSDFDRMYYYLADGVPGFFWGLHSLDGRPNAHWSALKVFADVARLGTRVAACADRRRGLGVLAAKDGKGRAALYVAVFRPVDNRPIRVSVSGGAGRIEEVRLEDGRTSRLWPVENWTYRKNELVLPNDGESAIWYVAFGGYRAPRVKHLERDTAQNGGAIKTYTRADLLDETGKVDFALVFPRSMLLANSPLIGKVKSLLERRLSFRPEIYGDDDGEKISQARFIMAVGVVTSLPHERVVRFPGTDDQRALDDICQFLE